LSAGGSPGPAKLKRGRKKSTLPKNDGKGWGAGWGSPQGEGSLPRGKKSLGSYEPAPKRENETFVLKKGTRKKGRAGKELGGGVGSWENDARLGLSANSKQTYG